MSADPMSQDPIDPISNRSGQPKSSDGKKSGNSDKKEAGDAGPPEIDKLIHEPARLAIIANLYIVESADFLYIMKQTGLTFGNLSSHMTKLENAGYLEVIKEIIDRKPHTMLKMTEKGREEFQKYKASMQQFFGN